jgi:hypothetical protein
MSSKTVRLAVALVVFAICAALPGSGVAAGSKAGGATAAQVLPHKKKPRRCRWVRRRSHGHVRRVRVCRKRHKPPAERPETPESPPEETPGENGGGGGGGGLPPGKLPPIPEGYELVDLIEEDNGFESSVAGFGPNSASEGSVQSGGANPIEGEKSLEATVHEYGKVGHFFEYGYEQGPLAASVTVRTKLRVDSSTATPRQLKVCAIAYLFETNQPIETCETFAVDPNQVNEVFLEQSTDGKKISRAYFQLALENSGSVNVTLDDAHLFVVQKIGSGGSGGGGGGGGGGGRPDCDPSKEPAPNGPPDPASHCDLNETPGPSTTYTPKTDLNLPPQHPFVSLADYLQIPISSPIYQAFKGWVDDNVDGAEPDGEFSTRDAVIMFARTGDAHYIERAIALVDADVQRAEARIAAGEQPTVAGDNYLDVGAVMEELALTYDYGFSRLTQSQKDRWKNYGDQVISNLWSPATATWGGAPPGTFDWSAWAINDPGNNYNYSFILATELWALATQSQPWIHFLQEYKFPLISDYYAGLPGGGSREGTGYGGAQRRLWENERIWKGSTGEALPTVEKHARESADFWIHATVPTRGDPNRDYFAPAGDLSRESVPHLYDYQVNLVREAAMAAAPNSREADNALWWIRENKGVPETMTSRFNLHDALLVPVGTPTPPTALSYDAPGVGELFARSSWAEDATWLQFIAGPYDQSHAHEEQGAFTLYRDDWLAVTSNIWSRSGLQGGGGGGDVRVGDLGTGVSNVVRFEKPGPLAGEPQVIGQDFGTAPSSFETLPGNLVKAHADLTPMYSNHATDVKSWKRDLEFQDNHLHVHDKCEVGASVTPVFQVNVPVQPVSNGNGILTAGKLEVAFNPAYSVRLVDMTSFNAPPPLDPEEGDGIEFNSGWRIDLANPGACEFDVDLTANP